MKRLSGISLSNVLKNATSQLAVRLLTSTSSLLAVFLISFFVGFETLGNLTKVTAFITIFYLPVDFGLNTILLRDYFKEVEEKAYFLLLLRLILSAVVMLFAITIALMLPYNERLGVGFSTVEKAGIFLFSLTILTYGLFTSMQAPLQKRLEQKKTVIPSVFSSLLLLVGISFGITLNNFIIIVCSYVLSSTTLVLLVYFRVKHLFPASLPRKGFSFFAKKLFMSSIPLGFILTTNVLYSKSDIFILSLLQPTGDVGIYGFSYKIFELLITIPAFISMSVYPLLIEKSSSEEFTSLVKKYLSILLLLSLLIALLTLLFSPFMALIKSEFRSSVLPLQILSVSFPFFFTTSLLQWVFILKKKLTFLILVYAFSLILNIVLNVIFIPEYSYNAAAVTTVLSEGVVFVLFVVYFVLRYSKNFRT